jgi:hypothetical protein
MQQWMQLSQHPLLLHTHRGFFSTLFLRAAKLAKVGGGGSMTLLPLIPGRPATGVSKRVDMSKYQTLSEEQKAKMQAVLEAKMKLEAALVQVGCLGRGWGWCQC